MKNNEITIKAEKNGLLPTVDAYALLRRQRQLAGAQNPNAELLQHATSFIRAQRTLIRRSATARRWATLFNSSPRQGRGREHHDSAAQPGGAGGPGAVADGVSAVADAAAAALHADSDPGDQCAVCVDQRPGAGEAAQAGREYAAQSLDAEQKKYKLGASTSALVLQQQRNLANAEDNADLGDGGVCKGPGSVAAADVEHAGCVRHQHHGRGERDVTTAPVIPGLTAPTGAGSGEADFGGAAAVAVPRSFAAEEAARECRPASQANLSGNDIGSCVTRAGARWNLCGIGISQRWLEFGW